MAVTQMLNVRDYVALDLETTGFDQNRCDVIEMSAAKVQDGKVVDRMTSFVRPRSLPIPERITRLTGITDDCLADAPALGDALPQILAFSEGLPIVGQNVTFDARFIWPVVPEWDPTLVDTMRIAKHVFGDLEDYKLGSIVARCEKLAMAPAPNGTLHRAECDVDKTVFCYETMRPLLVSMYGEDPENGFIARRGHATRRKSEQALQTVDEVDESNPFFGTTMCITGALDLGTRDMAKQMIANLGAEWKSSISKKVDYLVLGNKDFSDGLSGKKTSKLAKAEELQDAGSCIEIVSEDFFVEVAKASIPDCALPASFKH